MLAVGYQNEARLWDVNSGQLLGELIEQKDGIEIAFSPDGAVLLTKSNKSVKAWDGSTGRFIASLDEARPPVLFSPTGHLLATASPDKSILLWGISSR